MDENNGFIFDDETFVIIQYERKRDEFGFCLFSIYNGKEKMNVYKN